MSDTNDQSTNIAQLDVHIEYLRKAVDRVEGTMATKTDIEDLKRQMGGYVPRTEFEAARKEWAEKSVGSLFDRIANAVIKIGAVAAVVAAAAHYIVLFTDRGPK